jgi:hypothetical protein
MKSRLTQIFAGVLMSMLVAATPVLAVKPVGPPAFQGVRNWLEQVAPGMCSTPYKIIWIWDITPKCFNGNYSTASGPSYQIDARVDVPSGEVHVSGGRMIFPKVTLTVPNTYKSGDRALVSTRFLGSKVRVSLCEGPLDARRMWYIGVRVTVTDVATKKAVQKSQNFLLDCYDSIIVDEWGLYANGRSSRGGGGEMEGGFTVSGTVKKGTWISPATDPTINIDSLLGEFVPVITISAGKKLDVVAEAYLVIGAGHLLPGMSRLAASFAVGAPDIIGTWK